MAALTGNAINTSYLGLLKTTDNAAVGATVKAITDGGGNAINLSIGTGDINFTGGNVDFSAATVTGLPSAGLVNGVGVDSLVSAASLTTNPAQASQLQGIALGEGANSNGSGAIAIGYNSTTTANFSTAVGWWPTLSSSHSIGIGVQPFVTGDRSTCVGVAPQTTGYRSASFGFATAASGSESLALGKNSTASATRSVVLGAYATANAAGAVAIGDSVTASVANYTTTQNLQLTNYASLNFADDTAAAAGGVPLGGIYHTSGALKIRIA